MRILVCNNAVRGAGGTDTVVAAQVQALRSLGHDVRTFGLSNSLFDERRGAAKARLLASCVYSVPVRRALRRVLGDHRPSLVYVHNTVPLLTGSVYDALREHRVLTVQYLHNFRGFCPDSYGYRDSRSCDLCSRTAFTACAFYGCYRDSHIASSALTAARLVDCARGRPTGYEAHAYIATSAFVKQEHVRRGLPADRIHVLHNPAEDLATPAGLPAQGLTQAGALTAAERRVTFVGSLLRAKGVYSLLGLAEQLPDWAFSFIGTGTEAQGLERQAAARRLGNVRFTGALHGAAKAAEWRDSFVTAVPSLWEEAFGLVVPESYSLGIPVLASGRGGLRELVDEGSTGFIVDPAHPAAAAAAVQALWDDREARGADMRRAARRLYEAEFTEEVYATRLDRVQAAIVDHRPALSAAPGPTS